MTDFPRVTDSIPRTSANYYQRLGVSATASIADIRHAYHELVKRYHPDTTTLPAALARQRFQFIQEAYETLNDPIARLRYDQTQRQSAIPHTPPPSPAAPPIPRSPNARPDWPQPKPQSSSAYLDAEDRSLSTGEVAILFILAVTLIACLGLAITLAWARGEVLMRPPSWLATLAIAPPGPIVPNLPLFSDPSSHSPLSWLGAITLN